MAGSTALRVLTLNVWGLAGAPSRQRLLHEGIARLAPDLVALQEVARTAERDQLAELLDGTGLHGIHQLDVLEGDRSAERSGTALATRWPPVQVEGVSLAVAGDGAPENERRFQCALAAVVPLPNDLELLFLSVKPAPRLDAEAARLAQAQIVAALDERLRRATPTVVAGDFDATPESDSMRLLTGLAAVDGRSAHYHDAWAVAGDGSAGHTWTTANPLAVPVVEEWIGQAPHARRIDYVLVGSRHVHPDVAARVTACRVVLTDPPASDHYGVLAEIAVEPRS